MAELHIGEEIVAIWIHAEDLDQIRGLQGITARFRHLLALGEQEAMAEDRVRDGHASRHEHGRPNNAVETDDVLAHEVILHGPRCLIFCSALRIAIADARKIRQKRIRPHIGYVTFIEGQRNAPIEGRTRDGKVLQTTLHERNNFILTRNWADEIGVLLVEFEQLVFEIGKLEEPVLFPARLLNRTLAIRANVFAFLVLL